jgi:CheY-like chemotaxis protein
VLLLDDDEGTVVWMGAALRGLGHEVQGFTNGRAALDAMQAWRPQLIIADIMMPEMDGLTFARLVREHGNVPVMLISISHKRADAVLSGAIGYIQKPATAAEVRAAVERVLGRGAQRNAILVVEDDDDIRDLFVGELQPRFVVIAARHGAEALETLRSRPIDLVITDIHMPVMNGVELVRAMRSDAALEHIPVIVQTSDRSALRAPLWRELQVAQLVYKADFLDWLQSRIVAHMSADDDQSPNPR